ncbi:cysteine hydrolase family protein [uncultured Nevskia sp.]|uniref:cysteine hydrolase family protein n=1 Tax=uncultured Nevskia sp. TaxID=228950 RepID=UPI0025D91D3C|nr:cysteine hydrolase family protein [uncultured Nevskia sp.]
MAEPRTLTQIAGAPLTPSPLASSALLVIDLQNEYQSGALPLDQLDRALNETKKLLSLARANGVPVFHFQHKTGPGAPIFDPTGPYFGLIDSVKPIAGEAVIEKNYPNCFTATGLDDQLKASGRTEVIIAGAMTHMCISATARSAFDHGYRATVVADACATRSLPGALGGSIPASQVHDTALAEIADGFNVVVKNADAWA